MIQIDMEMPKNCLDCTLRYQSFCSVDGHHEPHLEKERCPLKVTPQEPILDKIRVEIENDWQLKKYPSSPFSCGLRRAIEIIDKYKAESEVDNGDEI